MPVLTGQQSPGNPWQKHRSVNVPVDTNDCSIDIKFKDVVLTARSGSGQKSKQILKGLNGLFKSGELTAIMGPSGAGKTSLLNILTGYRTIGMKGTVMSNDKILEFKKNTVRKQSAYIMQDDRLSPFFTVQEIMNIAAQLKLGTSVSYKAKMLIIEDILDNLSMTETRDTRCSKLSGGQKKRLSIALELIDNPSILYLDEPTTGLDSSATLQLIRLLSVMAHQGKTVICTIHQPSASIFDMFDLIYVVAAGRCVYQGTPKSVISFLDSINIPCPKYHNPADFLLDVVSGEFGDYMDKLRMNGCNPAWRLGSAKKDGILAIEKSQKKIRTTVLISPPTELEKLLVIMKCIAVQIHRDWTSTYLKLILHIFLGLFIGSFYTNVGLYGDKTINNVGYLMAILVYTTFLSMLPATLTFPPKLQILMKERFNNWYNFKTYFLAFFLVNSPLQIFYMWIFIVFSFFLSSQFYDFYRLGLYLAVGALTTLIAEYMGIALGTFDNPSNAIFNGSVYLAINMVLAGFGILIPHMPIFFYYLSFGSFMRFSLEALVTATYGHDRPSLPCPNNVLYCQVKVPSMVIDRMGMDENNLTINMIYLCGYAFVMVMISFFSIRRTIRKG